MIVKLIIISIISITASCQCTKAVEEIKQVLREFINK